MRKKTILAIFVILLLAIIPASNVLAEPAIEHPFDSAALLMFSANMRLDGSVTSAQGTASQHLLAPSLQAGDGNEIDALIDLYAKQIANLRASDTYSEGQEATLIAQLEAKVQALIQQAQALNAKRSPTQPRAGLGRALRWAAGRINQGAKGLGRVTGKLVGAVMDGTGKIVEFAIEDVAPQVLKESLQSGVPINAALVRRITRELLVNRVTDAFLRDQQRRAEQRTNAEDGIPTVDPTWEADFMEAFDEGDETPTMQAANGDSGSEGSNASSEEILSFDFPLGEESDSHGSILWSYYWDAYENTHANANCLVTYGGFDSTQGTLHLEINLDAETISGYAEFSGTKSSEGEKPMQVSGSYRIEFSDVPNDPDAVASSRMPLLYYFQGESYGTGTANGFVTCQTCPNQICGDPYQVSAEMVHNQVEGTVQFRIFPPESPDSAIQHWIISGGTSADNWYANFYLDTDYSFQP